MTASIAEGEEASCENGNQSIPQNLVDEVGGAAVSLVPSAKVVSDKPSEEPPSSHPRKPQRSVPARRVNRPGFNSYLKVLLDEVAMNRLHQLALQVRQQVDERFSSGSKSHEEHGASPKLEEKDNRPTNSSDSRKRPPQPFRFKPRSRESLHMTLFFGGEILCELPPEELMEWHGRVRDRLKDSGFVFSTEKPFDEGTWQDSNRKEINHEYWFRVVDLCVFPPHRRNLVVAVLEASPAWHAIHDDLRNIAKHSSSPALADLTSDSNKNKWKPHITLGNLYGGNKADIHTLSQMLRNFPHDESGDHLPQQDEDITLATVPFEAIAKGICMGGPIPQQSALDWEFCQS